MPFFFLQHCPLPPPPLQSRDPPHPHPTPSLDRNEEHKMDDATYEKEIGVISKKSNEEPPTSNVFLHKHEARSMLTDMRTKLTDLCKASPADGPLLHKLVRVNVMIASNLIEVESHNDAYEYLERAELMTQALRNKEVYNWEKGFSKDQLVKTQTRLGEADDVDQTYTPTLLELFNLGGFYWCGRGKIQLALSLLEHSEKIYKAFDKWATEEGSSVQGLQVSDKGEETTGGEVNKLRARVETEYTSTMFYFAQVYGNDSNSEKATKYCHLTMHRQLASKKEFDRLEWSVNALGLCSFYLSQNNYGCSFHCIEAAELVIQKFIEENTHLDAETNKRVPNTPDVDDEKMNQTLANIQQAYGKWYHYLVKYYKEVHLGLTEDDEPAPPQTLPVEWWVDFPCEGISKPSQPGPIPRGAAGWPIALDYWKKARVQYYKAMEWYSFEDFVTDYIQLVQDLSSFLKVLLHWDGERHADRYGLAIDRKCAVNEERLKLIEKIPQSLSEKHYLNYCRQCWFEAGEIYNDMAELRVHQRVHKNKIADKSASLSKKAINKLLRSAAKNFDKFAGSFRDDGKAPADLDPDFVGPYTSASMHAIRLRSKQFADSPQKEYKQIELACAEYSELVAWAEDHPQFHSKLVKDEAFKVCHPPPPHPSPQTLIIPSLSRHL